MSIIFLHIPAGAFPPISKRNPYGRPERYNRRRNDITINDAICGTAKGAPTTGHGRGPRRLTAGRKGASSTQKGGDSREKGSYSRDTHRYPGTRASAVRNARQPWGPNPGSSGGWKPDERQASAWSWVPLGNRAGGGDAGTHAGAFAARLHGGGHPARRRGIGGTRRRNAARRGRRGEENTDVQTTTIAGGLRINNKTTLDIDIEKQMAEDLDSRCPPARRRS
jgi:hypothetical protein